MSRSRVRIPVAWQHCCRERSGTAPFAVDKASDTLCSRAISCRADTAVCRRCLCWPISRLSAVGASHHLSNSCTELHSSRSGLYVLGLTCTGANRLTLQRWTVQDAGRLLPPEIHATTLTTREHAEKTKRIVVLATQGSKLTCDFSAHLNTDKLQHRAVMSSSCGNTGCGRCARVRGRDARAPCQSQLHSGV